MEADPMGDGAAGRRLRFGTFELDVDRQELRRDGLQVELTPQPQQVLAYLAMRPGRLVTREELRRHLWGDETFVEWDLGLNSCVRKIRRALRDDAQSPRFLKTVPRRGYVFIVPVEEFGVPGVAELRAPDSVVAEAGQPTRRSVGRRVWLAVAVVAGLSLAGLWLGRSLRDSAEAATPGPRVAVLPIEDLRGGETSTPFARGLTEELLLRLARRVPRGVSVLDRSAATHLASGGGLADPSASDFLLRCSLRASGSDGADGLRLIARLVRGQTGEAVWTDEFDARPGDELEVQEQIATAAAAALGSELRVRTPAPVAPRIHWAAESTTPEASDAYLRGLYLLHQGSPSELDRAVELFDRAVRADEDLSAAHAGLACAQNARVFGRRVPAVEGFTAARQAAKRALAIDPEQVEALVALGYVQLYFDHDPGLARRTMSRARDLSPGFARSHSALAAVWSVSGQHDRAVAEARLARDLDPVGLGVHADLCWYLVYADEFDEAVAECRRSLELKPGDAWTLLGLAEAHLGRGEPGRAVEALRQALGLDASVAPTVPAAWKHLLDRIEGTGAVDPFTLATVRARSGDVDGALIALEQAAAARSFWMVYARLDPRLDALHGLERFETLTADLAHPGTLARGSL